MNKMVQGVGNHNTSNMTMLEILHIFIIPYQRIRSSSLYTNTHTDKTHVISQKMDIVNMLHT